MSLLTREEALELISHSSKRKHSIAVGLLMRKIARKLGENETEWELVGLLHDLDFDSTTSDRSKHGVLAASQLEGRVPEPCLHAIRSHDFRTGVKPQSRLDFALIAADTIVHYFYEAPSGKTMTPAETMTEIDRMSIEKPWIKSNILGCMRIGMEPAELVLLAKDGDA